MHRSPLGPLLLFLPISIHGSSLSVSVQTGITPGPNCSMQAMTMASCSSSVGQFAMATSTATASYGDLFGRTQSGGAIIYGTSVAFDTSYSEMLTITAPNHAGAGTLISRFELLVMAQSDGLLNPLMSVCIHQGQATYDSGLTSNIPSQEQVVTSTFQFGVPFVFSGEIVHSWNGCCTDSQGSLGLLQLTSFTVLDGDNNTLANAVIANDQLSTPEPRTTPVVAVGLLALVVTLRKRAISVG